MLQLSLMHSQGGKRGCLSFLARILPTKVLDSAVLGVLGPCGLAHIDSVSALLPVCRSLPFPSTLLQNAGHGLHQLLLLIHLVEVLKFLGARCTRLGGGNRQQLCQRELLLLARNGPASC